MLESTAFFFFLIFFFFLLHVLCCVVLWIACWWSAGLVIERLRVRIAAGAAGEFPSPGLSYSSLSDSGPEYLSRVLRIYTPSRQLRSSSDNRILCVPSVKTKNFGQRSFSYAGPVIWNKLSYDIRSSQSKTSFKQALKTHVFITHY